MWNIIVAFFIMFIFSLIIIFIFNIVILLINLFKSILNIIISDSFLKVFLFSCVIFIAIVLAKEVSLQDLYDYYMNIKDNIFSKL